MIADTAAPPAASGLSKYSMQALGGMPQINWTDLFTRLMGMGSPDTSLSSLMQPVGAIPQLGPVTPPMAPARVGPAVAPAPVAAPAAPMPPGNFFLNLMNNPDPMARLAAMTTMAQNPAQQMQFAKDQHLAQLQGLWAPGTGTGFGTGIGASGMDSGYGFGIGSAGGFSDASGWGS